MKLAPAILSATLLGGIALQASTHPRPEDALPFHAAARLAVQALPVRIGAWTGTDVPLPPAAWSLLRPNAIASRVYAHPDGRRVNLIVVQCGDARDMSGHYPPVCYPSRGWTATSDPKPVTLPSPTPSSTTGNGIPATRYEFARRGFLQEAGVRIYGFFVLPNTGYSSSMTGVRSYASDVRTRPFGAAQVQFVFDRSSPAHMDEASIADLLGGLGSVLTALRGAEEPVR